MGLSASGRKPPLMKLGLGPDRLDRGASADDVSEAAAKQERAMRLFGVRFLVVAAMPFCIIAAIVTRLWREIRSAVYLAYLDVRMEINAGKRAWRDGHFENSARL